MIVWLAIAINTAVAWSAASHVKLNGSLFSHANEAERSMFALQMYKKKLCKCKANCSTCGSFKGKLFYMCESDSDSSKMDLARVNWTDMTRFAYPHFDNG